ncbi:MAG: hypothetical protein RMX97_02585 [Nostoc sp. DedQUE11]|nr:hypothetical protein [Nostoc sp. SerVER01]MDZ8023572.1 hypothetical protein [Nostoc sp. DedQUE11]
MKSLTELITQASLLINEISEHPDYKVLLDKGYQPDLTVGDAQTALVYLIWEVEPPSIPVAQVFEVEVSHE